MNPGPDLTAFDDVALYTLAQCLYLDYLRTGDPWYADRSQQTETELTSRHKDTPTPTPARPQPKETP